MAMESLVHPERRAESPPAAKNCPLCGYPSDEKKRIKTAQGYDYRECGNNHQWTNVRGKLGAVFENRGSRGKKIIYLPYASYNLH